jgi:hypothetical protein
MAAENVAPIRSDDPEMLAAIQEARASIKTFLDALMSPMPKQSALVVKIAFVKRAKVEHIWLAAPISAARCRPASSRIRPCEKT